MHWSDQNDNKWFQCSYSITEWVNLVWLWVGTVNWETHYTCSAEHLALPICAHRFFSFFFFFYGVAELIFSKWISKKWPENLHFHKETNPNKKNKCWARPWLICFTVYLPLWLFSGTKQASTSMAWCPLEGHLPAVTLRPVELLQLLKDEGQTLTLRAEGLAELRQGSSYRWGSSSVSLTVDPPDQGSAQTQWHPSQPSKLVGVAGGFHGDHLPLSFAALWMTAFCCGWRLEFLWWSQDQRLI